MTARPRRSEAGFTLIEMLMAMVLSTLVLGVTVTAFVSLMDEDRLVTDHQVAQEQARVSLDRMARHLRNLASPTALMVTTENRPRAIESAGEFDLVVRLVDDRTPAGSNTANVMRRRWCLDEKRPSGVIWVQDQRWTTATPPAAPSTSACPGPGWDSTRQETRNVVNRSQVPARPLFTYNSANPEQINRVHSNVVVDPTPNRRPLAVEVTSGVALRNQNQFPEAGFELNVIGTTAGSRTVRLDGSASRDPEGQPLNFCWFIDPPAGTTTCAGATLQGVVVSTTVNTASHRFLLVVEDPAGLRDTEEKTLP